MIPAWRRIRPGWYVLAAVLVYAVVVTLLLGRANEALREARRATPPAESPAAAASPKPAGAGEASAAAAPGLWMPIPGASLPSDPAHLPGAPRTYRRGVSQGFDFYGEEGGVPVVFGTPVIAATNGTVVRADRAYTEPDPASWEALLVAVSESGATEEQLDRLRGRQVWIRGENGRVFRYAHLSAVREGLEEGQRVVRGQVIGFVGNSGTDDGVRGGTGGARLHFEIWNGDEFFGEDMSPDEIRIEAASMFTGP